MSLLQSKIVWRRIFLTLVATGLVVGLVEIAIHHFDPTRVVYKRLKAPDPYLYEEIDPTLFETDVASLIRPEAVSNTSGRDGRF